MLSHTEITFYKSRLFCHCTHDLILLLFITSSPNSPFTVCCFHVPFVHCLLSTAAVFDVPSVVKSSDSSITAHINDSKALQCQFNAPTLQGVTIVVWMKGDMSIVSSEHYTIVTSSKPGHDSLLVSQLTINSITSADQGRYSCYCYYNTSLVKSSKQITSNEKTFRVYLKKSKCI